MNERVKSIFAEAQKLAPEEREELAELLLATIDVDPEIDRAWADEIVDRVEAHERGEMPARPASEILAKYLKT
jgi:Putative addiction module component